MERGMIAFIVLAALAAIVLLWLISAYNGLVRLKNRVKEAWAQIEVRLKRRFDLIPNLVETVKAYAKHESQLLEAIAKARAGLVSKNPHEAAQADTALESSLCRLWAVVESYPELKANQSFTSLQAELAQTENKIALSRQGYNDAVLRYNDATMMIPTNVVAGMFDFRPAEFFEVDSAEERKAVKVQF